MSDVPRRIARWQIKCTPERTKATLDSIREDMRARYEAATAALAAMEIEVKQTLNAQGVNTINYVPYLSYARQLFKLSHKKNISGESLAIEAKVLADKWAARSLNPDVLAAIRFENFSIDEPKP
ncbi:MAG: hypothetical protein NTX53_04305 [candidate division WOR-3 bacterium]|nr:hypothetical protein [candidate division WOR-3 bacterium]